ncbi:MAG: 50S ribosomal protein L25 [Parcubacteria group bacterium]
MPNLNAEIRESSTKPEALRATGLIPAEIYGKQFGNKHITILAKEFGKVLEEAGENTIVNLKVENEILPVLIHDHQKDAISGKFMSVDFFKVRMDEKITAPVPLIFSGESIAVKELGGVLIKSMDEIEVEALPMNLPHEIEIDIGAITELDQSIYVKDIPSAGNYEIVTDPDTVIATVSAPEEEVEEAPATVEDIVTEDEAKRAEAAATEGETEAEKV